MITRRAFLLASAAAPAVMVLPDLPIFARDDPLRATLAKLRALGRYESAEYHAFLLARIVNTVTGTPVAVTINVEPDPDDREDAAEALRTLLDVEPPPIPLAFAPLAIVKYEP